MKTLTKETQEYVEKCQKSQAAYNAAIIRITKENEDLLEGESFQTEDENGFPRFCKNYKKIRENEFTIAQIKSRLQISIKQMEEAIENNF